jgi:carboxymethylenebutenolidase
MGALQEGPIHDVTVEDRTLPVDGADMPVVHARPDGMPVAGVVLHPDLGGIRPLFEDMARRLATHGFAVCVTEPFARVDRSRLDSIDARMGAVANLDDAAQLALLDASADLLVVDDDVSRVGVLGFCMGGYYTFKAAASDRFDTAVAFYGMLRTPDNWRGAGHSDPVDAATRMGPTLAIFGSVDPYTPPADIEALRAAWRDRDDCEIVVVEGADHGFVHDPDRPVHRADDAATCWTRAIEWLAGPRPVRRSRAS